MPAHQELLLAANKRENSVSFVQLPSGLELARVPTGDTPHELAISPDRRQVAVVAYGGKTIDILDIDGRRKLRTIDLSPNSKPHGIAWLRDGRICVTTEGSEALTIVDTRDGDSVHAIPTGQKGTHLLAISPDERRAYASDRESGAVTAFDLDTERKLADVQVGGWPEAIAVSPDGKRLWVADADGNRLLEYDTATLALLRTERSGAMPIRLAFNRSGTRLYVSDSGSGSVMELLAATGRPLRELEVSGSREAEQVTLRISGDGRRLYVAETARNDVAEVDLGSGKVLRRLRVGDGGDGLAIMKEGK
jgi:YVTN family beta-propeller protein